VQVSAEDGHNPLGREDCIVHALCLEMRVDFRDEFLYELVDLERAQVEIGYPSDKQIFELKTFDKRHECPERVLF
jgi:hypothetical protein